MYDRSAYYCEGPNWMTSTKMASAVIKLVIFNKMSKSRNKECPCFIHKQDMKIVDVATRFHKSWKRTEHIAQIQKIKRLLCICLQAKENTNFSRH